MTGHVRPGFIVSIVAGLLVFGGIHATTSAEPEPVACKSLKTMLSDNKNYYIFEAKATGDTAAILGYMFDFGDHQSYTFTFKPGSTPDRHTATVTHAYQKAGTYASTVHVVLKNGQKTSKVTSDACKTSTIIEPPAETLPVTGASVPMLGLFMSAAATGTAAHYIIRKYRSAR